MLRRRYMSDVCVCVVGCRYVIVTQCSHSVVVVCPAGLAPTLGVTISLGRPCRHMNGGRHSAEEL